MQDHLIHWLDIAGTAVDALLFLRVLGLRLYRTYLFVLLYCAVSLVTDAAFFAAGSDANMGARVLFYSRFVFAVVYPLAVWDVFEEGGEAVQAWRKAHVARIVAGLTLITILALLIGVATQPDDAPLAGLQMPALLIWTATISACVSFLWSMRRLMRKKEIALTGNMQVLWVLFVAILLCDAGACLGWFAAQVVRDSLAKAFEMAIMAIDMAVGLWAVVRLRGAAAKTETQTEP